MKMVLTKVTGRHRSLRGNDGAGSRDHRSWWIKSPIKMMPNKNEFSSKTWCMIHRYFWVFFNQISNKSLQFCIELLQKNIKSQIVSKRILHSLEIQIMSRYSSFNGKFKTLFYFQTVAHEIWIFKAIKWLIYKVAIFVWIKSIIKS